MSTQNRRSSFSASTASSMAKKNVSRKRTPLSNVSNQRNLTARVASNNSVKSSSALVPGASKFVKKGTFVPTSKLKDKENTNHTVLSVKSSVVSSSKSVSCKGKDETASRVPVIPISSKKGASPIHSDVDCVSMDETISTCNSFKSPEVEYMDNSDVMGIDSIGSKIFSKLCLSDCSEEAESIHQRDAVVQMKTDKKVDNIDDNYTDPQLCASIACDIHKHLRASEVKKRPSTDFIEKIQKDINSNMRSILIDWLVEVAEEYRLVPETLYLTVNYVDRYLSGNAMNRQRLQLLGVACMMIASKYEEICAPQVEEFCYITDNTYLKEEVLDMESAVLNYLKFEMTAPTVKCFLSRYIRAAQGVNEVPSMQLECMASYVAELSLLDYSMLCYAPSLIAASAVFLAKYILFPLKQPWDFTLQHYTLYQPSDLSNCVEDLHRLCCNGHSSNLPAIREKYSHHKYKYVATKYCPPTIPLEFLNN